MRSSFAGSARAAVVASSSPPPAAKTAAQALAWRSPSRRRGGRSGGKDLFIGKPSCRWIGRSGGERDGPGECIRSGAQREWPFGQCTVHARRHVGGNRRTAVRHELGLDGVDGVEDVACAKRGQ